MKHQNDWYTGTEYHSNYPEKEILIEKKTVEFPVSEFLHERVEMIYILSGEATVNINGCEYKAREGCFFCLYSHHFYNFHSIKEKIELVSIKFYIGLFMYMSWEKHPKHASASLMYDTRPMIVLFGSDKIRIENIIFDLLSEKENPRFEGLNMIIYKTLELHAYFCRYAYENISDSDNNAGDNKNSIWSVIEKILLTTQKTILLKELAAEFNCSERALNHHIKKSCGYSFFQLQQFAKINNAKSLLHFPDLSMEYISELLEFSSVNSFYRLFVQYCHITPREYQKLCIADKEKFSKSTELAMDFLQYVHLNFMQELTVENVCERLCVKEYTVNQMLDKFFNISFKGMLNKIRINYAASFLSMSDYSILEISSMCGFDSYTTFQRAFKTYMNQTPSQYRKMM